ncbi:MAG: CHRD domain-containing protein [candidate division Zixibacteria bacterium]|nr:CHRD domain-containing protein [candidate division Zixibacteria bacterium]
MIPPQTTDASGTVDLILGKSSLSYKITLNNASNVNRAELYVGAPNSNGTQAAVLFSGPASSSMDSVLVDSALLAEDFTNISLDSTLVAAANGAAYVQIATLSAPQGLLRGQTAPSGNASLVLGSGAVQYDVRTFVLDGIISATLNEGTPGRFGDVKVVLFEDSEGRDDVNGRLASDVFRGDDIVDSTSVDSLITLIRNERTYINIITIDVPQGVIRGQVELAD